MMSLSPVTIEGSILVGPSLHRLKIRFLRCDHIRYLYAVANLGTQSDERARIPETLFTVVTAFALVPLFRRINTIDQELLDVEKCVEEARTGSRLEAGNSYTQLSL
jgi:hypothetical protein